MALRFRRRRDRIGRPTPCAWRGRRSTVEQRVRLRGRLNDPCQHEPLEDLVAFRVEAGLRVLVLQHLPEHARAGAGRDRRRRGSRRRHQRVEIELAPPAQFRDPVARGRDQQRELRVILRGDAARDHRAHPRAFDAFYTGVAPAGVCTFRTIKVTKEPRSDRFVPRSGTKNPKTQRKRPSGHEIRPTWRDPGQAPRPGTTAPLDPRRGAGR